MSDLEDRKGLPPELRVLAEEYPRELWTGHANFPGLTAFWLDMHGKFRSVSAEIIAASQTHLDGRSEARQFGSHLSRYTGFLLQGLEGHHSVEDHHYFPIMEKLDTRVSRAFELLDHDHHDLHGHMTALAEATNAVLKPLSHGADFKSEAGHLLDVQQSFSRFVERHLFDEEDVVIPLLLKYGPDHY